MKKFSEFLDEALLPSLIKAAARQFVKTKALQKAVPKATTIPVRNYWTNKPVAGLSVASKAPEKVKSTSTITGFRSGGANRGSNFNPMKGSKYQFDPVKQTSISNTAPGHISTPAGIKPKSSHTRFGTPSEIATAKQKGDLRPLEKTPKIGLNPYEKWKKGDYPAGVEYAKGKFSEPNWSPNHMGSSIVDIQTRTGSQSNLPLFGAERREIRDRVKAGLQRPANIEDIKRQLGIKPKNSSIRNESVKEQKSFSQFINEAKEARPPKEVLRKIDRAYGFEKNRGRFRDFTTRDTDIRNPQVSESKARQDIESSRYEDDVYRTTQQKLANPRLRRLRILLNRELGRHTV